MSPDCCQLEACIAVAQTVFCVEDVARDILHTKHIVRAAAIQASNWQQSGGIIPHAVIHSLVLLKMGKELPQTCWANLKMNKLLLLHLVGPLLYLLTY